jgi:uncharacterized protein YifN (PemK superfamily)
MPIQFNPILGSLLRCDYTLHANPQDPEIGKARPVIVLARPSNGLCIVVPVSATPPVILRPWHVEMDYSDWPTNLHNRCWAKCDCLATVAHWRLDRYYRKDQYGKRKYLPFAAKSQDFAAIQKAVLAALGGLS